MRKDLTRIKSNLVLCSLRAKTKGRRMLGMAASTLPSGLKCFECQGFGHMKQECPTYLKTIGKSKAFAATLSNTEPEDDSDNEDDKILNAFTAIVNLRGLLKIWMKKRNWWSPSLRRWIKKMTSTQPIQSYTRSQKSMRRCIRWPPRSLVMWSLSEKKSLQSLMKQIRLLEH